MEQPDDDRRLVADVLAGQPAAFERLVARHQALCWHIIYRLVRHPEDARDLCQDCFLRIYRYLSGYRHECSLKTWIGRVAYSTAMRYLQRKQIPQVDLGFCEDEGGNGDAALAVASDDPSLEAVCITAESLQNLSLAVDSLPPLQRTLITLYHLEELPISEISKITGVAEGTVKSHLCRTRLHLRKIIERHLREKT